MRWLFVCFSYLWLSAVVGVGYAHARTLHLSDSSEILRLSQKAQAALARQQPVTAAHFALAAAELAREQGRTILQAENLLIAAQANQQQENTAVAMKYYLQSKKILEQHEASVALVRVYEAFGAFYEGWQLDHKAQEFYLKAYHLLSGMEHDREQNLIAQKIAEVYYKMESYDSALFYLHTLFEYHKSRDDAAMTSTLQRMTAIGRQAKKYRQAIGYQYLLLNTSRAKNDTLGMMDAYYHVASIYQQNHRVFSKILEPNRPDQLARARTKHGLSVHRSDDLHWPYLRRMGRERGR